MVADSTAGKKPSRPRCLCWRRTYAMPGRRGRPGSAIRFAEHRWVPVRWSTPRSFRTRGAGGFA